MIYNRKTKTMENDFQYGGKFLKFLYNTVIGRVLLKVIILPVFSKIGGKFNDLKISTFKINSFIKKNNIDMNEYEEKDYKSFNEFFYRKKKALSFDSDKKAFISPADSKLIVYEISDDLKIKIKQSVYTLSELLDDTTNLKDFKNGNCLVFRLSVNNYHRYCFIDDGTIERSKNIKGKLHTVCSISEKHKIYSQNSRVCNYLNTENFGKIIYIEVGALLVGKINNRKIESFSKGEEKGYFELGGSTIVILTTDKVKIDNDIIAYTNKGIETKVEYGERIGERA